MQSLPPPQLALGVFLNVIVTDPVAPPWHHTLVVTADHAVLLGAWLKTAK